MIFDLAHYGNSVALIKENGERITYNELARSVNEIGSWVRQRQLVFCFCQNDVGAIAGYAAFLNYEVVPILLDWQLDKALVDNLIDIYKPALLWLPEAIRGDFDEFESIASMYGYALLQTKLVGYELHDELALLLTTSGSTGSPKLVRQSYTNVISNTKSIVEYLGIEPHERAITTLPMQYTYGLSVIQTHLFQGATLVLTDKSFMQREFWDLMQREKVTSISGVPYTYEMLQRLRFFQMVMPYLRTMTQAGGKLDPLLHKKLAEYAKECDKKFVVMYGAAEATARMAYLPPEKSVEKYGSIGVAIPGGSFSLIDENGHVIQEQEVVGELVYRGLNVAMGYASCGADLANGDEWQGELKTGDLAKCDCDGYYYVVGRKKRFLKLFGKRISLDELEQLLRREFQWGDIVCSGRDDKLYIFTTKLTISDLLKPFVTMKMKIHPSVVVVCTIEEIPKNSVGKIQYEKLVKYYASV